MNPIVKALSSTSPRATGDADFDINVEGAFPGGKYKYTDLNIIFKSCEWNRQILPPPAGKAERGKRGMK